MQFGLYNVYQISTMLFFEQYNMGIPLFAPSVEFLAQLNEQHFFVSDRVGELSVAKRRGHGRSIIQPHPAYNGSARALVYKTSGIYSYNTLDPNNEVDPRALRHWLSLADFYTMPHVVHFHSVKNLVDILDTMWKKPLRLQEISNAMRIENRSRLKYILRYWRRRLLDIKQHSRQRPD